MLAILIFFFAHWNLSVFAQTFFHHRYGAHRMFTMSPRWERFFYIYAFVAQGTSFLVPRAYGILHREHHAFSDTERDPHSPLHHANAVSMMWKTKARYDRYAYRRAEPEARFLGDLPEWRVIDRLSQSWITRISFGALYSLFYLAFAPSPLWLLLLPVHFFMGPIHGAIVNWCGHRYGYRNFNLRDQSRNALPIDLVTLGELFQNNHHARASSANFAARWFEVDPCFAVMRVLAWTGVIRLSDARQTQATPSYDTAMTGR